MAVSPSPSVTLTSKPDNVEPVPSPIQSNPPPDPSISHPTTSMPTTTTATPSPSSTSAVEPPNSIPPSFTTSPLPSFQTTFTPGTIPPPPFVPSFRPVTSFPQSSPQFSPLPNPNFQNPNIQPPGVNPVMPPAPASGAGSVPVTPPPPLRPMGMYQMPPGQLPNPYGQMPNGYSTMPPPAPQGAIPPPGIPRYPTAYTPMVRPTFPPRPPVMGMLQPLGRPPVPGIRGVPPVTAPVVRPVIPIIAPTEKPQTTVYVGKIASTVENDFILSLLRLCGPVKSWKRAQDPSNGTPRGFGFCEFESAEGVLRALRLLSKFSVDGQELVLNVNQATREYLERYVEKKTEREKMKEAEAESNKKEEEIAPGMEKAEPPKHSKDDSKDNETVKKETQDSSQNFGIVTDEDREADRDALEKLQNMLEERLKAKPLPGPPAQHPDASGWTMSEPTKSRDGGADSDVDIMKNGDDKNDEEMTSEIKPSSEQDRPETSSPERSRKHDRRSRERDRERDLKREKERELERYERERERERVRREREREMKIREAERLFKERLKEWESREADKMYQRKLDRDREKERERERKREINDQEEESDDDDRKRRRRSSTLEEKRRKRKREKEDDMADRLREEEEITEAKKREIEQKQREEDAKNVSSQMTNGNDLKVQEEAFVECRPNGVELSQEGDPEVNHSDDVIMKNGVEEDSAMLPVVSDTRQSSNAPTRKLGFGLVSSGKRTAVPSVFHEEDEDEENKDKKMRPLVPIDYSTEELQAVQTPTSGTPPPNLVAAAEFAKRISNTNPKDEKTEVERDRNRRPSDRSIQRERDRNDEERHHSRDEYKERTTDREREREHAADKLKAQENKKLLDAKQLIDMIPKTKEELFAYEINWGVYDKHDLRERMRPWISKKVTEFLGEEEATLVDYIVSKTNEHVRASEMLELLKAILDDEAEMFVLKMWRMLIFEIKKVETGLAVKPKN